MKNVKGGAGTFFYREIRSDFAEADSLCLEIRSHLAEGGQAAVSFPVELVARECIENAILHGNHRDASKKVSLSLHIGRKYIHLQIMDEGKGFNWRKANKASLPEVTAVNGRGLAISSLYAERITYNARGNQIRLRLKKENEGGLKHGGIHNRA